VKSNSNSPVTIDEYIATFPKDVRKILSEIRRAIQSAAPDAEERISYRMPAFFLHGILVYFAAFRNHIGFFPTLSGIRAFESHIAGYKSGKGTLHFPIDKPIPVALIKKIVKFRVAENLNKKKVKAGVRKKAAEAKIPSGGTR
jgi:uncharacterized protein YdhG (YjbR/CyaY superfamily)